MWFLTRPDALRVLTDKKARKALNRYFKVVENELPSKFMIAKTVEVEFNEEDELNELWSKHEEAYKRYLETEGRVDRGDLDFGELEKAEISFLDLKRVISRKILSRCRFCMRGCSVDRMAGELGWCKSGKEMYASTMFMHMGEEPELVPSFTVFTIGCTMRCIHCQNWSISQRFENGTAMTPKEIAYSVDRARDRGARNLNMVGGDPTSWLYTWLCVIEELGSDIPLVWNSNSYYSSESATLLQGLIDVYLLDLKYGNDKCAIRLSRAPWYWDAATRNLISAKENGELIIRLLVLPEHLECCYRPIINWIVKNLGPMTRTNIMWQYRPEWRAHEIPELRRRLNRLEKEKTLRIAEEAGLKNYIT